jgi:HlyD family secretion protein
MKYVEVSERAQIRSSEIDLQQAKIELKRAETNAGKMIVKAPIGGLLVMQNIFRGSDFTPIQQGDQLWPGQFFMSIVDTRSMVVNATVNQADVERLHIGDRASVRFDAYSDLTLPARVYSVSGIGRTGGARANYLKEIPVRLKIENTDPRVIPDLSVNAEVVLATEKQVPVAPLAGIFRDSNDGQPYVFVQTTDGWERRAVILGLASNRQIAIREGLKADDVIALEPPQSRGTARN